MKAFHLLVSLFFLSLISTSSTAQADPTHDCSGGCWIVTCGGSTCTLWRCDALGCRAETTFPNHEKRASELDGLSKALGSGALDDSKIACTTERCVVKMCDPSECVLYGLVGNHSSLIGRFENTVARIEDAANAFMEEPAPNHSMSR
jgi:hypothetical protein